MKAKLAPFNRFKSPSNLLLTVPRWYFCCGSLLPVFWYQSFGDVSPYVRSFHFSSVWVAEWPPFWERAALSVDHFTLYFDYL